MKIVDFLKHLKKHDCELIREGGNHSVYFNRVKNKITTVPRHKEIKNNLCRKICKDFEIPSPF